MRIFFKFLQAWAAFDLAFAQYRRDRIDYEMMHGERPDVAELQRRRARISSEIAQACADHNRWTSALHGLDIQARPEIARAVCQWQAEMDAEMVLAEHLECPTDSDGDIAYDYAVDHCAEAIRKGARL